jgi:hypothetical protein
VTVVVVIGVVVERIVLLIKWVPVVWVVRLIVESIVGFIEFDVRSANTTQKKKEIIEKSIKFDILSNSDVKKKNHLKLIQIFSILIYRN